MCYFKSFYDTSSAMRIASPSSLMSKLFETSAEFAPLSGLLDAWSVLSVDNNWVCTICTIKRAAWAAFFRFFEITCGLPPGLPYKPGHMALMTGTNELETQLCQTKGQSVKLFTAKLHEIISNQNALYQLALFLSDSAG